MAATTSLLDPAPTRLSREEVAAAQRGRLLRAMAEAAGDKGFGATTVGDVVALAGVSRKTFYEHFANLEDCFVAAYDACIATLRVTLADAFDPDVPTREQGRRMLDAYLRLLADEPAIARTCLVEGFSAGPRASERRREAVAEFAALLRGLHDRLAAEGIPTRPLGDLDYELLVGALIFTVTSRVAIGDGASLPALAGPLDDFLRASMVAE